MHILYIYTPSNSIMLNKTVKSYIYIRMGCTTSYYILARLVDLCAHWVVLNNIAVHRGMLQFKGARMRLSFADMPRRSTETPAMRARGRETLFFLVK